MVRHPQSGTRPKIPRNLGLKSSSTATIRFSSGRCDVPRNVRRSHRSEFCSKVRFYSECFKSKSRTIQLRRTLSYGIFRLQLSSYASASVAELTPYLTVKPAQMVANATKDVSANAPLSFEHEDWVEGAWARVTGKGPRTVDKSPLSPLQALFISYP